MRQWVERAKTGDREAFELLVGQFRAMAHAVACDKLGDAHLAEDAVQEAYMEAFLHLDKLKEPDAFPGWFRTIVARQCHRQLRRKKHGTVPLHETAETADSLPGPSELAVRAETDRLLRESVAELPPHLRLAVQMFYWRGCSLQEISDSLGQPVSTWKKRLHDARSRLKGKLPIADFVSVIHRLHEGGIGMLHVVNGDSVADKLRQGKIQGEILVWREVYSEGPVFLDASAPANRSVRAEYLRRTIGVPEEYFVQNSEEQERRLEAFGEHDEIVLWFEHDLFDQTMLCRLLHFFNGRQRGGTKLNLLCIGDYPGIGLFRGLGQLSADQLIALSGTWHEVGPEELKLGAALWEAYCAPAPDALVALLQQDTRALPFAHRAFTAHLSRFPSVRNGLGVAEQTTLEAMRQGAGTPLDLFRQVGDALHELGMGDLQFWGCLARMTRGSHPLLEIEGADPFPDFLHPSKSFLHRGVKLTEHGRKALEGTTDGLADNGIDEWLGGVHLQGRSVQWRWDTERMKLISWPSREDE